MIFKWLHLLIDLDGRTRLTHFNKMAYKTIKNETPRTNLTIEDFSLK